MMSLPDLWPTLPIAGIGGGFTHPTFIELSVEGTRIHLPLTIRVA
jgi:hypothetical protein